MLRLERPRIPAPPRLDHHFCQIRTVFAHWLGEQGACRVAGQVVGGMKEKHWHAEPAAVDRFRCRGHVSINVHVPGVRTKEAVAL